MPSADICMTRVTSRQMKSVLQFLMYQSEQPPPPLHRMLVSAARADVAPDVAPETPVA